MIGTTIRTLIDDEDTDVYGRPRAIPAGTLGTITSYDGDELYDIAWANGGWTRWTREEIQRDAEVARD